MDGVAGEVGISGGEFTAARSDGGTLGGGSAVESPGAGGGDALAFGIALGTGGGAWELTWPMGLQMSCLALVFPVTQT